MLLRNTSPYVGQPSLNKWSQHMEYFKGIEGKSGQSQSSNLGLML